MTALTFPGPPPPIPEAIVSCPQPWVVWSFLISNQRRHWDGGRETSPRRRPHRNNRDSGLASDSAFTRIDKSPRPYPARDCLVENKAPSGVICRLPGRCISAVEPAHQLHRATSLPPSSASRKPSVI